MSDRPPERAEAASAPLPENHVVLAGEGVYCDSCERFCLDDEEEQCWCCAYRELKAERDRLREVEKAGNALAEAVAELLGAPLDADFDPWHALEEALAAYEALNPSSTQPRGRPVVSEQRRRWTLRSKAIHIVVNANDQWEAWDRLNAQPALQFGLIVTAEPDEGGDDSRIGVHTETLMRRWGREADAQAFHQVAVDLGLLPS